MKYFWLLILSASFFDLKAQINLIANNSFERIDTCGSVINNPEDNIWGIQSLVNVDSCFSRVNIPEVLPICYFPNIHPHSGDVILNEQFDGPNVLSRNEQVSLVLKDNTNVNQWYYIEYWIKAVVPEFPPYTARRTGVFFTNKLDYSPVNNPLNTPVHFADTTTVLTEAWTKISGCFQLDSVYRYMAGFALTNDYYYPSWVSGSGYLRGSFRIDDVILSPIDTFLTVNIKRDTICVGDCILLSCNFSLIDATFDWDLPGSDYAGQDTGYISVCYDTEGVYNVGLAVDHCVGTYNKTWQNAITVVQPPVQIDPDFQILSIVEGEEVALNCIDTGLVDWYPHTGLIINGTTAMATDSVEEGVLYTCIYGDTLECGVACQYMFEIQHYPVALFDLSAAEICEDECIRIFNESEYADDAYTYILENADGEISTGTNEDQICTEAGIYTLSFVVNNSVGTDTFVYGNIMVDAFPDEIGIQDFTIDAYEGDTVLLINPYMGHSHWYTLDSANICGGCDSLYIVASINKAYNVSSYLYDGCALEATYNIRVLEPNLEIFLPTGFTPNNDGINDTWKPYHHRSITVKETTIFNRNGAVVYKSSDPYPEWTGIYGDKLTHLGVYIVLVKYEINGKEEYVTGDITLYR